jgi:hypothetical protein
MRHEVHKSAWDDFEEIWLPSKESGRRTFEDIKKWAHSFLLNTDVEVIEFSHYGILVKSIEDALEKIKKHLDRKIQKADIIWIETFGVYLYRSVIEGGELELIEPAEPSFFKKHIEVCGEGLHHLGFYVKDIDNCIDLLKFNRVVLVNENSLKGSHGYIVFMMPQEEGSFCIEICQRN